MLEKHRDNKGRVLRSGETQQPDGRDRFRYTDSTGNRRYAYSRKLVDIDRLKKGQKGSQSLRNKEKRMR